MPRVPTYERQVRQQNLPNVRASASAPLEAFGGGESLERVTRAAGNLAGQVSEMAYNEKVKADDARVTEAYAQLSKQANDLFWNPQSGAMLRKGKNAFGVSDEYGGKFDKIADKIAEDLSNDDQRRFFTKVRFKEREKFSETLDKHTFQESQKYEMESAEAAIDASRNDAVLNYADDKRVTENIALQQSKVADIAQKNGLGEEWAATKALQVTSKTHREVIEQMLANQQSPLARNYFAKVGDSLTPDDKQALAGALKEGSLRYESQKNATVIMGKFGNDMKSALAEARKIEDADIQAATVSEVKTRFSENEAADRDRAEKRFLQVSNAIETTKERPAPAVWQKLTLAEKNAVDSRIKQLREGIQPATDWDTYYNLRSRATSPELRSGFLQENMMLYRAKLADSEFKELVHLQSEMRSGKGQKELDGFRTNESIVNDSLKAAGIDSTPDAGTTAATQVNQFRAKVDEQVRDLQRRTGKPASNEEVQSVVDGLLIEGITQKRTFWWDTKKRLYELKPGEKFEVESIEQVPQSERSKIESRLKARGVPVTDDTVLNVYLQMLSRRTGANR